MPERTDQTPDVHTLLNQVADRLDEKYAHKPMLEPLALAQALVVAEHTHGPTPAADAAERAIVATLPPIRTGDTRAEYAARVRLIAQEVAA
ncbi:hypothetical protein [Streptomyces sp. NPDC015130]|uniref:hypothetical protein n=1 Tax=Streptomyces sp. NPDC015130 TaxID=3364940 RepID=UPI0036FBB44F